MPTKDKNERKPRKLKTAFISERHFLPNSYYPIKEFTHVPVPRCFTTRAVLGRAGVGGAYPRVGRAAGARQRGGARGSGGSGLKEAPRRSAE